MWICLEISCETWRTYWVSLTAFMGAKKTFERLLKKNPANRSKTGRNQSQWCVGVVWGRKNTISTPTEAIAVQNSTKKCVFSLKIAFFSVFSLTGPPGRKCAFQKSNLRFRSLWWVDFGSRGAHLAYLPHSVATACWNGLKSRKIGI